MEKKKLSDLYEVRTGGVLGRMDSKKDGIPYKLINLRSIDKKGILNEDELEEIELEKEVKQDYLTKKGDIIVRLREPVSACYIEKEGFLVSNLFGIIRGEGKNIDKRYITHFLNSYIAKKKLNSSFAGSAIKMLKIKSIGDLKIELPPLEEQIKVSRFMDLKLRELMLLEKLILNKEILLREDGKKIFR